MLVEDTVTAARTATGVVTRVGDPAVEAAAPEVVAGLLLEAVPPLVRLLRAAASRSTRPLTLNQFRILTRLEAGPRLVGELAAALDVRAPTASVAADGLVRRGLVERLVHEDDRRVVPLALTPAGRRALRAARGRQLQALTALLSRLEDAERDALQAGVRALIRAQSGA